MNEQEKSKALIVAPSREVQQVPKNYWDNTAAGYTLAFRTLLLVLVLFIFLFMVIFSGAFTYDSIMFFAEDLRSLSSFAPSDTAPVPYMYMEGDVTTLGFAGGVARVGADKTEIYAADGKLLVRAAQNYAAPRAAASRKYLVSYDCGGNELAVYNSYARLESIKTDFPIYLVSVSDAGYFAVVTGSDTSLSRVLLYDNRFNLVQTFHRGSVTVGAAVSENGQYVLLAGARADGGDTATVVDIYKTGAETPAVSYTKSGEFPLAAAFMDDKRAAVMTDTAMHVVSVKGGEAVSIYFGGGTPKAFSVCEEGGGVVVETDRLQLAHRVIAFDKKGNLEYETDIVGDVLAILRDEEQLFLLNNEELLTLLPEKEQLTRVGITAGAVGIWKAEDGGVRLFYEAEAVLVPTMPEP